MTKSEMVLKVAEVSTVAKKDVKKVLEAFTEVIISTLKKEKKVKLTGLGIFAVKHRNARIGRNPRTGEQIQIAAKKVVKFRVAKEVKTSVL